MSNHLDPSPRSARLAQALRANLRRRKAQISDRSADPAATELAFRPMPVGGPRLDTTDVSPESSHTERPGDHP